ncbi:hypothetical protein PR001_g18159 [Phytophthora rubi]|uniref:Uncharacterized protein n=1 Tax=Phytophthora rubi TaxID=129364 RepID=A0A6A3KDL0_9STRA|nr:hypothetical protein PR001_g18159 [Phytophthora rubi]
MHPVYRVFKPVAQWLQVFAGRLPGEYTVAKLDAFDRFRLQTSPWQVTGILLLTPMGCLVANVLIESIPLADPATGFYGSLHFQKLLHRKRFSRFFSLFPGYQHADYVSKHQKLLRRSSSVNLRHSSVPNVMTNSKVDGAVAPISKMSTPILPTKRLSWKTSSDSFTTEILVASFAKSGEDTRQVGDREQEAYVRQVTSALRQTEIVLLRSYITIFALPFYGLYQALLFSLPNRRYFVTMATTTTFDAVAGMIFHMLLLCGLELLFLAVYMALISHRVGFSGLHQLAFVLWSQRILIQGKFVMLPIMILGFPLEHFGNGSIFKIKGAT